jgi:hypothetical protein
MSSQIRIFQGGLSDARPPLPDPHRRPAGNQPLSPCGAGRLRVIAEESKDGWMNSTVGSEVLTLTVLVQEALPELLQDIPRVVWERLDIAQTRRST